MIGNLIFGAPCKGVVFQRVRLPPGKQTRSSRKESERPVEVTTLPKPLV